MLSVERLKVTFGIPLFLFHGGVYLIATLLVESGCILHIHFHVYFFITFEIGYVFVLLYSSNRTLLLNIFILVLGLILLDFQMLFNVGNAPLAFEIRACTSFSESPSVVILLPR